MERSSFIDCIGIDPGTTNIGIAILTSNDIGLLYQIHAVRNPDTAARIQEYHFLCRELLGEQDMTRKICVEGASYGDRYRQVELAEMRASVVMFGIRSWNTKVMVVPPPTIRKRVFDNGKMKAQEYWQCDIPNDALAALSCAYYADMM